MKMFQVLVAVRKNIENLKKSPRVADESMVEATGNNDREGGRRRGHGGLSLIYSILHAPISILSCVSNPNVDGSDGVWVSADHYSHSSDINHLMVNDGMRYAILI